MSQGGADSKHAYDALSRPVSRSGDAYLYNARSEVAGTTLGGVWYFPLYDNNGNPPTDFRA